MKPPPAIHPAPFALAAVCIIFAGTPLRAAAAPGASTNAAPAAKAAPAKGPALALPRLKPTHAATLAANKYEVDALQVPGDAVGAHRQTQLAISYLAIDARGSWARNLRGRPNDVVFVSFCANASVGSEIEIAGAALRVEPAKEAGKADVVAAVRDASGALAWKRVGLRCSLNPYGGQPLAELPVLTVRVDPAANVWDLYVGTAQMAAGLPLVDEARKNARRMTVVAGGAGAQLCGVVIADDNPLFIDENGNGIEDGFEIARAGALLTSLTPAADRNAVVKAWLAAQRTMRGGVLGAKRPASDRVASTLPPGK